MERQKSFAEYPDSDQSISEEEECVSLRGLVVQKEKFQILSMVELQKGYDEQIHSKRIRNLLYKKEECLSLDDDVEIHTNKDNLKCSPRKTSAWKSIEDIITNDKIVARLVSKPIGRVRKINHLGRLTISFPTVLSFTMTKKFEENDPPDCGNKRQDGSPTWCTINQEAEALVHENKVLSSSSSHSTFSKVDRPCKGIRGKSKPKLSFHFQSQRRELSHSGTTKDEHHALFNLHKQPETESETGLHFPMECLEDIEEENDEKLDSTPVELEDSRREHSETSIAELLDGLQDNTSLQSDGIVVGKKGQIATKRDVLLSCDRHDDNEDSTKSTNRDSPSEWQDGDQNLKCFIPKTSRQTITDKFEEFLGATSLDTENAFVAPPEPSRIALFGKLQQVMQTEKLRVVDFLDMLHSETSANDETDYLDVKILDKDFEAKLIVCSCFFHENLEDSVPAYSPKNMKNGMKKKKVIFNSRVCNNVDLGVGMFIRIHAPWKEISVGNGESIILSTYFSETSSL